MSDRDWATIRDKRIRGVICNLLSEMFDTPDQSGIYPTSKFMARMEDFIISEMDAVRARTNQAIESKGANVVKIVERCICGSVCEAEGKTVEAIFASMELWSAKHKKCIYDLLRRTADAMESAHGCGGRTRSSSAVLTEIRMCLERLDRESRNAE